jgi:transketolase
VRQTDDDAVTLIGAGITLHEAVAAADQLAGDGISARVIDLYSVKPIDAEAVRAAARETGAIVTVEDHWPEGGIGDAVLEALAEEQPHPVVVKLAVRSMPGSGTPAELLAAAGIDATHIADAARELVGRAGARGRSPAEVGSGRRE